MRTFATGKRILTAGSSWRYWPSLVASGLLAVCIWRVAPAMRFDGQFIYPLDDTYIHMGMAKNLAMHGVWGITRYEFSSSSSSPLWTLLLASAYVVTGVRVLTPLVLNLLCAVALLVVTDRGLARWSVPAAPRTMVLVGLVLAVPLPPLALMGMEHVLHLLLSVSFGIEVIGVLTDQAEPTRRRMLRLCLLGALLGASRYEGVFLAAIACLLLALCGRMVSGALLGAAALTSVIGFGLISMANGSPFLPNSLLLKAGGDQLSAWQVLFKMPSRDDLELFRRTPPLIVVIAASAIGAVSGVKRRAIRQPAVLMFLLIASMVVLHAHFAFSSLFWVYRHDAYLVGFGLVSAAAAVAGASAAAGSAAMAAVLAMVLTVGAGPGEAWFGAQTVAQAHTNFLEHYRAAAFIARYYPAGPIVVNDIGAASYLTDARLLDMFGLGSVEPIVIRRTNAGAYTAADVAQWTGTSNPAAAIVQLGWGWVLPRVPASWIKVAEVEIVPSGQTLGFFAMSEDAAIGLRQNVERFYGSFGADTYRLRLR